MYHQTPILYTGHGQESTGDWAVSKCGASGGIEVEAVSLETCLDVWISRAEQARALCLMILADCCYSGKWVKKLNVAKSTMTNLHHLGL